MKQRRETALVTAGKGDTKSGLWPSPAYAKQVKRLKDSIGSKIYIVELKPSAFDIGIRMSDTAHELIDVIDFPRPDPSKGIAPHIIILDNGCGINLGRIARISVETPFNPPAADILYQDSVLLEHFLFRERRLSKESVAAISKTLLAKVLGKSIDEPTGNRNNLCSFVQFTDVIESQNIKTPSKVKPSEAK